MSIVAYILAVLASTPSFVLSIECLLALLPAKKRVRGSRQIAAVLIPAHDESNVIRKTLDNVRSQMQSEDRMIVVADNCNDDTADIAESAGAEVVRRIDENRRGKGFALATGIEHLKKSCEKGNAKAPEVVIILDADCTFAPDALDYLACSKQAKGRPGQALYLMRAPQPATPAQRISAFAFLTKNHIRPCGLTRMGASVPLTGSGMAFDWKLLQRLELGSSEIVEDLDLGLNLVIEGYGPILLETAQVESTFPLTSNTAKLQRTRWEHGYLRQMRKKTPRLILATVRGNLDAFVACCDLCVPPTSLHLIVSAAAVAGLALHSMCTGDWIPVAIATSSLILVSFSLFLAWRKFGRETMRLADVALIPTYVLAKLPIYARAILGSEKRWVRTDRES